VIYGMGERFDGNIRKRDLTADTPWNTYTRDGLPPTPIAMPGAAALRATLHPAQSQYLYFVSRGDGTHEFSRTLEEHNRAVAKYQLGK
ncbi:MAG: endolytic transglycosylase MltG, partial [Usitatibacter sp.]